MKLAPSAGAAASSEEKASGMSAARAWPRHAPVANQRNIAYYCQIGNIFAAVSMLA